MNFCVISPASGLERFARKSHYHLVLSHVKNPLYRAWYKERSENGDVIILDNGAYEGALNPEELLESIIHYKPKVIVLPDLFLGDAKESFELARDFHKMWRHQIDVQWMYVPQGKFKADMLSYLFHAVDEIKPEWVGIPRVYGTYYKADRAELCYTLRAYNPDLNVHALGMLAGDIRELPELREAGCMSIDSSAPVWRGWNNFDIEDQTWNEVDLDVDFDAAPVVSNTPQHLMIKKNLEKCGVVI